MRITAFLLAAAIALPAALSAPVRAQVDGTERVVTIPIQGRQFLPPTRSLRHNDIVRLCNRDGESYTVHQTQRPNRVGPRVVAPGECWQFGVRASGGNKLGLKITAEPHDFFLDAHVNYDLPTNPMRCAWAAAAGELECLCGFGSGATLRARADWCLPVFPDPGNAAEVARRRVEAERVIFLWARRGEQPIALPAGADSGAGRAGRALHSGPHHKRPLDHLDAGGPFESEAAMTAWLCARRKVYQGGTGAVRNAVALRDFIAVNVPCG